MINDKEGTRAPVALRSLKKLREPLAGTVVAAASIDDDLCRQRFDNTERFYRIQADIDVVLSAMDAAATATRELEECWTDLCTAAFRDGDAYDDLLARLPADDPVRTEMGLLELLRRPLRETLHTAAIGSLIDPKSEGGIARLRVFLELVLSKVGRETSIPADITGTKINVETSYPLRVGRSTFYPRPDLRIDLGALVIVVENKVDDLDRESQLASYVTAARAYHDGAEVFFVYLTPAGEMPSQKNAQEEWTPVSYRELTLGWRAALATDEREGRRWPDAARAYLSTLSRSICKWRVEPERVATRAQRYRMVPYLRAATEGSK